jgi:hypothetical protein
MLRLDPAHPPLWRTPTTLQFGPTAVTTVDEPEPWAQRLVRELERGIPDAALEPVAVAFGAPVDAGTALVRRLAPALLPVGDPVRTSITVQVAHDVERRHGERILSGIAACGFDVGATTWHGAAGEAPDGSGPVVVVANHLVEPRRVSPLMARDLPHLPVVLSGRTVEVGPFIVPGRTSCIMCQAAHRRDLDPSWPTVAAQLVGRPVRMADDALVWEAGITAGRMIDRALRRGDRGRHRGVRSLTLRVDGLRRPRHEHRPHPECLCRSLAGSETAGDPSPLAPTSDAAFAVPA